MKGLLIALLCLAALPATSRAQNRTCYELRTYFAAEGKLDELHARFRDHTVALFKKHGMTNLPYFHLDEGQEGADTTLLYFLAHESFGSRAASFAAFRSDPDWIAG